MRDSELARVNREIVIELVPAGSSEKSDKTCQVSTSWLNLAPPVVSGIEGSHIPKSPLQLPRCILENVPETDLGGLNKNASTLYCKRVRAYT